MSSAPKRSELAVAGLAAASVAPVVFVTAVAVAVLFCAAESAFAGDPQAHSTAMIKAAKVVAIKPDFSTGVGAPVVDGVAAEGKFPIFIEGTEFCAYEPKNPFGTGCAYNSINGLAINEPDNWSCTDSRQPEVISSLNASVGPFQARLAGFGMNFSEQAAMVCNWNHFSVNSALPATVNVDATEAYHTVQKWGYELLEAIDADGATQDAACNEATWEKFYGRIGNALHYVQDKATEHHDSGNLICTNTDPIPIFSWSPIHDFKQAFACTDWLADAVRGMRGNEPEYWCDEAVVTGPRSNIQVNGVMSTLLNVCGFALMPDGSIDTTPGTPALTSLACMGLERTFRHHCRLQEPKSLYCAGPASDHAGASSNQQYCEGENYFSFGGEDFIGAAVAASIPVLEESARRWAETCKEPDDPCDPTQCALWCRNSKGAEVDGEAWTGYCMNDGPDANCVLHDCLCGPVSECGEVGLPCCKEGAACVGEGLECGAATGTCVEEGSDSCEGGLKNGDFSADLEHWTVVGGNVGIAPNLSYGCLPSQNGNPFVYMDVYGGDAYIAQTFRVPNDATTLSLRAWNALDPVTNTISLFKGSDEIILKVYSAPSTQALSDPNDLYSVICSGASEDKLSFDVSAFAGKTVELRLRSTWIGGVNGTVGMYDDVTVK